MKRCRNPEKDGEVFVIGHRVPNGDAVVAILCEDCGATHYTSFANRTLALERGMRVLCLGCARKLAAREKDNFKVAGTIHKGRIVEPPSFE